MSPLLSGLDTFLRGRIAYAQRAPRVVVSIYVFSMLAVGLGLLNTQQIVSIQDQLDPKMRSTAELKRSQELFSGASSVGFVVEAPREGFTAGELCQIKTLIQRLQTRHPEITNATSAFDLRQASFSQERIIYPALLSDPCQISSGESYDLAPIMGTPWESTFTNPLKLDFTVLFEIAPLDPPGLFNTFNPELVETGMREIEDGVDLPVRFIGTSSQEYFTMIGLQEMQWLNILAIVLIVLVFRLVFGGWRAGPLYFLTVGCATIIVFGGMGWAGHAIDPLSACLFLLLSVASLEDFTFVSDEMMKRPGEWPEAFARVAQPCLFTSISAAAAFLSLSLSDVQSVSRFGLWAALGAMVEWSALFILLPAVLNLFPKLGAWVFPEKARFQSTAYRFLQKVPPRSLSIAALLVFVGAWHSVNNFRLTQSPAEMFPSDHPFQQTLQKIQKERGWVAHASVVYEAHASEETRTRVRTFLRQDHAVERLESWEELVEFVASGAPDALARNLVEREIALTPFSRRYRASSGEARDIIHLKTLHTEEINRLRDAIAEICPERECWPSGEFISFADFSDGLIRTLFDSLLGSVFSVGLIVTLLTLGTGHLRQVPAVLLASFWGPAVMLTAIYFCGITINFVTCIVASTLIGLTGDNAIMFMHQGKDLSQGIADKGIGSIQTALIMSLVALTFTLSYFEPPRTLGWLLAGGFVCALLGDVWVLKGLLKKSDGRA